MQRRSMVIFFLLLFGCAAFASSSRRLYIIRLALSCQRSGSAPIICSYQGKECPFTQNCAIIPEDQERYAFTVVITDEVAWQSDGKTVSSVDRVKGRPCAWYDLTLCLDGANVTRPYYWHVVRRAEGEMPLSLPEHTLILLVDPGVVECLEDAAHDDVLPLSLVRSCGDVTRIYFPRIVFKKDITKDELSQALTHARLAYLDARTIHKEIECVIKHESATIVSLLKG